MSVCVQHSLAIWCARLIIAVLDSLNCAALARCSKRFFACCSHTHQLKTTTLLADREEERWTWAGVTGLYVQKYAFLVFNTQSLHTHRLVLEAFNSHLPVELHIICHQIPATHFAPFDFLGRILKAKMLISNCMRTPALHVTTHAIRHHSESSNFSFACVFIFLARSS